jgi:hypothetical protein
MGGSMIQLLAYGAQDVYLTGNPQVTFFQAVYKRNTNFAMEFFKNQINDTAANGTTLRISITRYGDLVGQCFFELPLNASLLNQYATNNASPDLNWVAERAFSAVELQIGNNTIDKHYQTWWRLYSELFMNATQKQQYAKMTTFVGQSSGAPVVYLPLNFFFNRNPGLFLPLVSLAYHEIQLVCTCAPDYNNYFDNTKRPTLWVNYVLLDSEERRRFAAKQHEYLIEQVQYSPDTVPATGGRMRIKLQHPIKELIWCYPNQSGLNKMWDFTVYPNFTSLTCNPQVGTDISSCGIPKLASTTTPWVEDGDIVYNTLSSNTIASYAPVNMVNVYTLSTPAATNIKSNIAGNRIKPYSVSATNNVITYTITGNSTSVSNTVTLTNGSLSNASVINDFVTELQANMRLVNATGLPPFVFGNTIVSVPNADHMNVTGGFHDISIHAVETSNVSTSFPMTLEFSGSGADLLGFSGKVYGNTLPNASNLFGFSNTAGLPYTESNLTANSRATFQYLYGAATIANPIYVQRYPYTPTSATPTVILDYLNNSLQYEPVSNTIPTGTYSATTLSSNVETGVRRILQSEVVRTNYFDFSNTVVSVDSGLNITVDGIFSNISTSPFSFDDASTINNSPNSTVGPLDKMTMYFNGQERFVHDGKFLNQVQPFYHHTGSPYPGIYTYSFALKPEDHQPTGTCNFSRLDNPEMVPSMKKQVAGSASQNTSQSLFAVNYNILRIKSGMAGIAFA